jgi:hypothetical protein
LSKAAAASLAAFASVFHARVGSLHLFHNMTVLVVYDSHLLQKSKELEEVLLEFRLVHLYFALYQCLEGGRLDYRHQMFIAFFGLPLIKSNFRIMCSE